MKSTGILICLLTTIGGIIYQIQRKAGPGGQPIDYDDVALKRDFFLVIQVCALVAGLITQKKAIMARKGFGLIALAFWIYFFACISQWCTWFFQFMNKKTDPNFGYHDFFSFKMLGHLFQMGAIFIMVMVGEMFNFVTLMYINKTGQVSKVALFSTLHASFIIIFGLISNKYSRFMVFYIILVYSGYVMIFYKKRKDIKKVQMSNRIIKFLGQVSRKGGDFDANASDIKVQKSDYFKEEDGVMVRRLTVTGAQEEKADVTASISVSEVSDSMASAPGDEPKTAVN